MYNEGYEEETNLQNMWLHGSNIGLLNKFKLQGKQKQK